MQFLIAHVDNEINDNDEHDGVPMEARLQTVPPWPKPDQYAIAYPINIQLSLLKEWRPSQRRSVKRTKLPDNSLLCDPTGYRLSEDSLAKLDNYRISRLAEAWDNSSAGYTSFAWTSSKIGCNSQVILFFPGAPPKGVSNKASDISFRFTLQAG